MGDLLRACGQNPTQADISDIQSGISGDSVDFNSFRRILERPGGFDAPGDRDDLVRGFQVFDKGNTGYIGVGELRYVLTSLGERMSEEEVDELLRGVETKDGNVNYGGEFSNTGPCDSR